jgi:hypothetical protein
MQACPNCVCYDRRRPAAPPPRLAERLCLSGGRPTWIPSSAQAGRLSLPACAEEHEGRGFARRAGGLPQVGAAEPLWQSLIWTAAGARRRIGGKSKGLPEGEERRKEKRLFFDTTEATILLKIKDRVFEKGENELVFKRQSAPKCTPKSPFLPIETPFAPGLGQITGGYMAFRACSGAGSPRRCTTRQALSIRLCLSSLRPSTPHPPVRSPRSCASGTAGLSSRETATPRLIVCPHANSASIGKTGGNRAVPLVSIQQRMRLGWEIHAAQQVLEARRGAGIISILCIPPWLPSRWGCRGRRLSRA